MDKYRLQVRHGDETKKFITRDDVFGYINGQLNFGGVSLLPHEPVLFYYGEENSKNAIIMIGLPEGETFNGNPYFIIDTAYLQEELDALDGKYDELIKELNEKLDKEIEERKNADDEEAKVREEKDDELDEAIKAEAKVREEKDDELDEAIKAETERAENAEKELDDKIEFSRDDIKSVIEACGFIYNEKLAEDRVEYSPDSHDEVIRDAESLAEAIDCVSKFATKIATELKFDVKNTETVSLTLAPNEKEGGSILSADVNIAGTSGLSKKVFDNNIIGKTVEGIYASACLVPSTEKPNTLIFKTSGMVDGKFEVDAFETEVNLPIYTGNNGKTTGINVEVDADKNVISAELNLASESTNILKLVDGEYFVDGSAKNIKYKDTTVAGALNKHNERLDNVEEALENVKAVEVKGVESETAIVNAQKNTKGDFIVSTDVKLSTDRSIIISDGGLKANVSADFKKGTSTLVVSVGNNDYNIDLSDLAVSVLKSASYDATTEELVLEFIVGDTTKTVRVPIGTLIHDLEVDDTDTIDLTLKSVSGGPNHLSAELRVDKSRADNILTVTSNGAYVSKSFITDAVNEEAEARKEAVNELTTKVNEVSSLANATKDALEDEVNRAKAAELANTNAIEAEATRAKVAEDANAAAIENEVNRAQNREVMLQNALTDASNRITNIAKDFVDEVNRAKAAELANANAIKTEETRALNAEKAIETKVNDNASKISSEIERSTKADKELETSVSNVESAVLAETNRAKAAELANTNAIEAEATRAKNAEAELSTKIESGSSEISTLKASVEQVKSDLNAETDRAKAAENANATEIANESSRAQLAETANASAIETEVSRAKTAEEANASAIESEIARAKESEKQLASTLEEVSALSNENKLNLALETKRAELAEDAIKTMVESETNRATEKENDLLLGVNENKVDIAQLKSNVSTLNDTLNEEVSRAKAAEEANATAISTETNRAEHAESDLLEKAEKNANDISAISIDVDGIELRKEDELAYALYVKGTKHGEFSIPKDQFLKSVTYDSTTKELVFEFITSYGDVTTKVSIADLVDTYVAGDGLVLNGNAFCIDFNKVASADSVITLESQTKEALSNLKDSVDAEVERAENKETELTNSINTLTEKVNKNASDIAAVDTKLDNEIKRSVDKDSEFDKNVSELNAKADNLTLKTNENSFAINTLDNKLTSEVERAEGKEEELANSINSTNTKLNQVEAKANDTDTNLKLAEIKLNNEISRATGAENIIYEKVNEQSEHLSEVERDLISQIDKKANSVDVYTKEETLERLSEYAKVADVESALSEKLNVTEAQNVYATKEALEVVKDNAATVEYVNNINTAINERLTNDEGLIDNFNLTYNPATSELVYTDKNGADHTYKLYSGSLIKKGEFDPKSNSIVLTIENAGIESQITIPVSDLLSDLADKIKVNSDNIQKLNEALSKLANAWEVKNSNTVELDKTTIGEKDVLTASVRVASSNKQAIQTTGDGLYVSNDLEDYTCVFGAEGTISGQDAISKLLEKNKELELEFETRITNNENEIARLKDAVKANTDDINKLDGKIDFIDQKIESVRDEIKEYDRKFVLIDEKFELVFKMIEEISKGDVAELMKEILKIKEATGYDTYTNPNTMSERLDNLDKETEDLGDEITNIKNVIIGPTDGSVEGSVWHELKNIVDAGNYNA